MNNYDYAQLCGKSLKEVAVDHGYNGKGVAVLLLKSTDDFFGTPVADGFSLRNILCAHPELTDCTVVEASDFYGKAIYRVI